ncbi:MAG: universal stress protein [Pseudomonadota bacterium]
MAAIRDILVPFNASAASGAALEFAAAMAGEGGAAPDAHVTALIAHAAQEDYVFAGHSIPAEAQKIIASANAAMMGEIEQAFAARAPALGLGDRLGMERVPGRVDQTVARFARSYDLVVMGSRNDDATDRHLTLHPDQVALQSGRPIVVVPPGYDTRRQHAHAVVAWDGRRAVARALGDALDLLVSGGRVTLLTIGDEVLPRPVSEIQRHLERHGIASGHVHRAAERSIAEMILDHVAQADPCLLVMGAYEHSPYRVAWSEGPTTAVARETPVPVLMAH